MRVQWKPQHRQTERMKMYLSARCDLREGEEGENAALQLDGQREQTFTEHATPYQYVLLSFLSIKDWSMSSIHR